MSHVTWPPTNCSVSTADSTFSNSSGHKWPRDGATENLALRHGDVSINTTVKCLCSKDELVKWAKGGSDLPQVAEEMSSRFYRWSCILPSRKLSIHKSIETNWSWVTIDDYLHGPVRPVNCKRSHMTIQNCSGQSLVPTSKWYDTAETVSTMIRQRSKRTFLQTFTISILDLDFSLVGPRPLYSILGNEESRIFGSC